MTTIIDRPGRLRDLTEEVARSFRRDFLAMVATIRNRESLRSIAELLVEGRFDELMDMVRFESAVFATGVNKALIKSAEATAAFLSEGLGTSFAFDIANADAVAIMRASRLEFIEAFTAGQIEATRAALVEGTSLGLNPIAQARTFRASVGLTKTQVEAVKNYRRLLQNGSKDALRRKLRDRRFDRTVARAIRDETPLTAKQIDRMVARYAERTVKFRAETIALTEALGAVHEGNELAYEQAIARGHFPAEEVVRRWITARDERVRGSHRTMHKQPRPGNEPFISGNGARLRFPGDSRAPASEIIRCRCVVTTRIEIAAAQSVLAA